MPNALRKTQPELAPELKRFAELDVELVNAAKGVKVLTNLSWPESSHDEFLASWNRGNPKLPQVPYPNVDFSENITQLKRLLGKCDRSHPVGEYLYLTTESYLLAAQMLHNRETPAFTELSAQLYGRPSDAMGGGNVSHLEAAHHFIDTTTGFIQAYQVEEGAYCLTADEVANRLREKLVPFFDGHRIEIVIDDKLTSKAAAAARRIRLRGATCFTERDIEQLLHHEGLVHMLTMLNGREQPYLKSFGLGAPRTTLTQEGLATFAELITSSLDLHRLQRLALRIRAVDMALTGADFIQVFKFFLEAGQSPEESFHSAARIFRGGDPRGKIVFTKDIVYLEGLVFTHTFLRKSLQESKFHYPAYLFAGRMALSDVVRLEPFFQNGFIEPPIYEPPWLQNRQSLAAYLCYAVFANRIALGNIKIEDFLSKV